MKNKGLTNWDWNFDYGEGLVVTWASNTTLKIPLNIEKSDNYKLFIRYFKNQKGGEIKVYLDGKPIIINTNDQLNKFVWKDFGTFKLNKGKHELILENVNGFNAVNLFTLIPEGEYYKARGEITKLLQNKTMIYLFEAESDLYRENAKIVKGIDYSNGEAIKFSKNGKAWQTLDIIKNGTYKLALKGSGEFKISLGNYTDIVSLNTNNFTYTPLFYLNQGTYNIKITPISSINNLVKIEDMPVLDVVWLYSTETNQTIGQLFEVKERPAKVINYTKINPTLWKVRVNATKPFMLNFAEAYDPLWEASIYKNGRKVEVAKSIPLYSVINGYWINQTGNLEITIRYKPQVWFDRGLIISLVTFIGAIGYLFYDWRRDKEDRWAKRLEKRFKR
ncbi:hypothetical protein BMS3Bbin15_00052 [archaeon BMS3Bbin15]|nr:hypothetical protein BMS3Bbin15_00052 [archaeon BMS3Bbin15]